MSSRDYAVDDYGLVLNSNHLHLLAAKICDGFSEKDWDDDKYEYLEELSEKTPLEYISSFTGEALRVLESGNDDWSDTDCYSDDTIYYIRLEKLPNLFSTAYYNIGEIELEFRSKIGKYLPIGFEYKKCFRHIVGSYFG